MPQKNQYSYNKEQFVEAVNTSNNISQALRHLGKNNKGRSYTSFRNAAKFFGVDISHIDKSSGKRISHNFTDQELRQAIGQAKSYRGCSALS